MYIIPNIPNPFLFTCLFVCVFFLVFYLAQPTRTKVVMAWSISTFAKIKRPFSFPIRAPYRERSWTLWCVQSRRTNSKRRRQVSWWWHPLGKLWEAFFLFVCFQWAHIKHVDVAQKNPKESMRTSLETTVERFSPVNSLGRNLPWVTSLGEFTYKFL